MNETTVTVTCPTCKGTGFYEAWDGPTQDPCSGCNGEGVREAVVDEESASDASLDAQLAVLPDVPLTEADRAEGERRAMEGVR